MWRARRNRDRRTVICIACGDSVLREDAREYDKEGDRWSRRDKEFEYLCTDCDDDICHQPRDGLESLILSIESDGLSREEFLGRYADAVEADAPDAGGSTTDTLGEPDAYGDADSSDDTSERTDRDR